MQVQCPRKDLYEAVQLVALAVTGRSTLPVLSHILLEAASDGLKLTATDLEVRIERTIPAIVGDGGSVTVPAKMIAEILGNLPDGNVTLESADREATHLQAGPSAYKLQGLPTVEFPEPPEASDSTSFNLPGELLRDMIKQVSFAVSHDEARPVLTGILMNCDGETLRLVATDTHRLAVREASVQVEGADINAVVPERAIVLLSRLPAGEKDTISVAFSQRRGIFEVEGARIVTQLIDGQFPNYQRVIPTTYTRRWVLVSDEFSHAVRRAAIVGKENSNRVIVKTEGEKLVITARSEIGEAHEEIDMAREGDDIEIAFNAKYVLDLMAALEAEAVAVELTEALRPALLKPAGEQSDYQCVIMPMALS